MFLRVLSQIERTIGHRSHNEQLGLVEQFTHCLREESLESDAVEQTALEGRFADMATDSEIRAELQEIGKETYAYDSPYIIEGLKIVEVGA